MVQGRTPRRHRLPIASWCKGAIASSLLATSGCVSFSYVDKNNVQHIIGFVHARIDAPPAPPSTATARMLDVRGFGLSLHSVSDVGSAFTLGYVHQKLLILPPGACVDLSTPGRCADQLLTRSSAGSDP